MRNISEIMYMLSNIETSFTRAPPSQKYWKKPTNFVTIKCIIYIHIYESITRSRCNNFANIDLRYIQLKLHKGKYKFLGVFYVSSSRVFYALRCCIYAFTICRTYLQTVPNRIVPLMSYRNLLYYLTILNIYSRYIYHYYPHNGSLKKVRNKA